MNWTMSKVLVTGGASFIGSHLVEKLLSLGCASVRVADDLPSGSLANLSSVRKDVELIFDAAGWQPRDGIRYMPNGPIGVKQRALYGERARRLMGWKPTVSIEEGIRRTVDWYTSSIDPGELAFLLGPRLIARGVA